MGRHKSEPRVYPRKDTAVLWMQYHGPDGELRRESSGTEDEKEAKRVLTGRVDSVERDLKGEAPHVEGKTLRVASLIDRVVRNLETHERHDYARVARSHWNHVERILGKMNARAVTGDTLEEYQRKRKKEGAAPSTIDKEIGVLVRGFRLARRAKLVAFVPEVSQLVKGHSNRRRVEDVEFADFEKLLAAIRERTPDLADWVEFQYWTGIRNSQISRLEWRDVDEKHGEIHFRAETVKVRERVDIAIAGPLVPIMARRRAARVDGSPFVFHDGAGGTFEKKTAKGLTDNALEAFHAAAEAVGLKELRPYDLRHWAVPRMRRLRVADEVRQYILGQLPQRTIGRYDAVTVKDTEAAFKALERWRQKEKHDQKKPGAKVVPTRTRRR